MRTCSRQAQRSSRRSRSIRTPSRRRSKGSSKQHETPLPPAPNGRRERGARARRRRCLHRAHPRALGPARRRENRKHARSRSPPRRSRSRATSSTSSRPSADTSFQRGAGFSPPTRTRCGGYPGASTNFAAVPEREARQRRHAGLLVRLDPSVPERVFPPRVEPREGPRLGAARAAARQEGRRPAHRDPEPVQAVPRRGKPPDRRAQAIGRRQVETGDRTRGRGSGPVIGPDSPLRLLPGPVDRAAGARGGCRSDPASRGRPLSPSLSRAGPARSASSPPPSTGWPESPQRARDELEDQNAQLRESERLKSDLVNTVSHELRTPLSGVLGFTKLLLTREFDSETRRHYLGIVDAQARRLSQLIDDFLDVRTHRGGRFERAREVVDLGCSCETRRRSTASRARSTSSRSTCQRRRCRSSGTPTACGR